MKNKLFKEARTNPKAGTEGLHFVVTQDDTGDTVLHVFDSEDQAGLYHGQLRGYGGIKRIGRLKGSRSLYLGNDIISGVVKQFGAEPRMIRHDQGETNPYRPRKGEPSRAFIKRCMSDEKERFPDDLQRIAVCLSKSRKRNPAYDTGSDE